MQTHERAVSQVSCHHGKFETSVRRRQDRTDLCHKSKLQGEGDSSHVHSTPALLSMFKIPQPEAVKTAAVNSPAGFVADQCDLSKPVESFLDDLPQRDGSNTM